MLFRSDLLQASVTVSTLATLGDLIRQTPLGQTVLHSPGPVFFKSCGWAGWDLAAVRCWRLGAQTPH